MDEIQAGKLYSHCNDLIRYSLRRKGLLLTSCPGILRRRSLINDDIKV